MDSAALAELRSFLLMVAVRVDATVKRLDQLIAEADRVCFDCHRRGRSLIRCTDGNWRGPKCSREFEAGAGQQLPIEKEN